MMKSVILAVILVVTLTLVSGSPSQLNYQINQEFAFNLNSLVDGRGRDVTTDGRTSGSYATMASTVVIQCTDEDADSYLFVMNMFGTEVNVGQGADTQSSTFATTSSYPSTQDLKKAWDSHRRQVGDDNALGDDMYFQLNKTGEIVQVWYQDGDSPYFVSVKLGAINAFATRVVQPGQTEKIMVSDPVGTHFATVMGLNPATNPGVVVNKTFNQEDVTAFPDPNLRPGNVRMTALTTTGIHEEGYIISSTVHQTVDLVNARQNPGTSVFPDHLLTADDDAQKRDGSDTLGFDMNLSSKGTLAIALTSMANAPTNSYFKNAVHTTETLQSSNYVRSSLFDLSVMATQFVNSITRGDLNVDAAMTTLFADPRETLMQSEQLKLMDKFADFLRKNPDAHQRQVLQKILSGESRHRFGANAYAVIRERILYVFVKAQDTHSLVDYGLSSSNVETSLRTLFAIGAGLHNVDEYLVVALRRMISSPDDETRRAALLTMGAVLARVQDAAIRQPIVWALTEHLQVLLQPSYASTVEDLIAVIDALGNAGPAAVSFDVISNADLITHSVASVRLAAVRAMRKFVSRQHTENLNSDVTRQQAASVLQRLLVNDNDYHVRRAALKLLQQRFPHLGSLMFAGEVDNSDFPFNKSYTTGFTVGGHVANATFFGELFAGTNLDCHQQYFNYEGLAEATVTLALFDWSKEAVDAEIVYGRDNGAPLADRIYLRVWDDVLYDKQIPTISCDEHTYPITSASPGFSVSYTVWVSVIPITFTASATLNLNLAWGWQICDSTLSAMVELIPGATLSIAGDVEVNVLIIRAGLELEGAFNTQIRPQASVLGDLCEIQFDVRQESTPMTADFNAYYEWNHCKFWIFDCHWGKHNEDVLWSWTEPAVDKILYQIDWPIKL